MRKIISLVLLFISVCISAQIPDQDKEALEAMDKMAEKVKSMEAVETGFVYTIVDKKEGTNFSSEGYLVLKGDMYKLDLLGTEVFYDGKTMWNYLEEVREVNITIPTEEETEVFFTNPTKLFTMYKEDFKMKYVGENEVKSKAAYEIDLYPRDLDMPYFRIKFFIDTLKNIPLRIIADTKNGVTYTIDFDKFKEKNGIDDAYFVFTTSKYPDVEVIDLRE